MQKIKKTGSKERTEENKLLTSIILLTVTDLVRRKSLGGTDAFSDSSPRY